MSMRRDSQWVRHAFFVAAAQTKDAPRSRNELRDRRGSSFSPAELKYTDTTLGGNFMMNPKPQFTCWADPKEHGLAQESKGMGEFYAEAIDDNARTIHLQFGIPEYNSMTSFFTSFYDRSHGKLVNTGEASSITFMAGYATGWLLTAPIQLVVGISNTIGSITNRLFSMTSNKPYSKFYYLKPTMPQYWSAVSSLVNRLGVNMGLVAAPSGEGLEGKTVEQAKKDKAKYDRNLSPTDIANLQRHLPDIYRDTTAAGIDIFAVSVRAQRLANAHHKSMKKLAESHGGSLEDYTNAIRQALRSRQMQTPSFRYYTNLPTYLDNYYKEGPIGQGVGADSVNPALEPGAENADLKAPTDDHAAAWDYSNQRLETANAFIESEPDYLSANLNDGGAFVSFAVDYDKEISESFSNSTKTSDIESKANAASSGGRSMHFNLMGGNIGDGAIMNSIEGFVGGVRNVIGGLASSVGLSGLAALGGAAYLDMPDFWDQASADLPTANYKIRLASPYGNKLAIYQNIYIPLCMLMAGALPRSTGRSSYSSPFICNLHDTGRNIIRLGVIESLQITRGTSNIGWSVDGLPTAIDVSFTIKNLEKVMHMPVTELAGLDDVFTLSMFDEDTALTDYLAAISGLGLYDRYYFLNRLDMAWRYQMADFNAWSSPANAAAQFAGSSPGRLLSAIYRGTDRFSN